MDANSTDIVGSAGDVLCIAHVLFEEISLKALETVAILVVCETVSNWIDALAVHEDIRQGTQFAEAVDETQTVWVDDLR